MGGELTLSVVWVHQSTRESHVPLVGLSSSATDSRIVLLVPRAELVSKAPLLCCAGVLFVAWLVILLSCSPDPHPGSSYYKEQTTRSGP